MEIINNKIKVKTIIFDLNYPLIEFNWDVFFKCIEEFSKIKKDILIEYLFSESYYHFITGKYSFDHFFIDFLNNIGIGLGEKYYNLKEKIIKCYEDVLNINDSYLQKIFDYFQSFSNKLNLFFLINCDQVHKNKLENYLKIKFNKNNILISSCDFKISKIDPQFWYFLTNKLKTFNIFPDESIVFEGDIESIEECKNFGYISFFIVREKNLIDYLNNIKKIILDNFIFDLE